MKSIKQEAIDQLIACQMCDDAIETAYGLVLRCGTHGGLYCCRECAKAGNWGPRFEGAKIRKLGVLKVEIT